MSEIFKSLEDYNPEYSLPQVNNLLSMYNEAVHQSYHNTKEDVKEYVRRYCDVYSYPSEICEHVLILIDTLYER